MKIEINRPAIWKEIQSKGISVRVYKNGYEYIENAVIKTSSPDKPIYRYAKNFTRHKHNFSMFMFTDEANVQSIEKYFEKTVKGLRKDDVAKAAMSTSYGDFGYLEQFYKGDN